MSLIFCSRTDDPDEWRGAFAAIMPDLEFRVWPDVGDEGAVEIALVWDPMQEQLLRFANLRLIASLGAGVDHLLAATTLPPGVPMTRIVDANLTQGMREYVLLQTLYCHRQAPAYLAQQRAADWRPLDQPFCQQRRVGIMGLGVLGAAAAEALQDIGFLVTGWSRRQKELPGVECFAGLSRLDEFLAASEILVCLLPLTPDTEGIINRRTLGALPPGACLINGARGGLVVEADLIAALESGRLGHAVLDVTREEPLPADDALWRAPNITITPHIASITNARSGAELVADNIRRVRAGEALLHTVDPDAGY
ncbi:MAG: glyoxylate/hydroxypyruvate reductase A [Alphaproteobacteria bacterium]|jgi:glyoxylate/hydroxypyruvate reductase A|nr:glyoxylate/hydroxypyruvate reductase A [Alphaproteobacteria bacterium]MDP6590403.1 glyoxylate/hydroxypyruvate reductase A [Alphaproteobacteria bacterium]MDP6819378.1 glyoxylate/hydroxypyruvate reductase A [Alphaproteobacteria bacterium]